MSRRGCLPCQDLPRSHAVARASAVPEAADEAMSAQRRQLRLDGGALALIPGRQLERGAQRLARLVEREARLVGRDLENHAARLAEIHRAEILPLDLVRRCEAELTEAVCHLALVRIARRAERDVMQRADAERAVRLAGHREEVDHAPKRARIREHAVALALLTRRREAEHVGQQSCRWGWVGDPQRVAV